MALPSQRPGTEDLEKDMLPSHASTVVTIALIVVLTLLVFNSKGLVDWTRQPQPGPVIAALEAPAAVWHGWMTRLGPAALFENARRQVQKALSG